MLIDSHSHLNFREHFADLNVVRQDMDDNGVEAAIVVGIDLISSARAIDIANEWMFPTVGIHPQEDNFKDNDAEWKSLEKLLDNPKVVAVGETGLDYFHGRVEMATQKKRFIRHMEYSVERELPLIVHCRDRDGSREASADTVDIIKKYGQNSKGVLHCYAGDLELGQYAMDQGWAISMAGNITFKKAENLREAVRLLKGDHFLVETDCPFLTPHPYRGKKNSPGMVRHTAKILGEVKGWSFEETIQKTRRSTIDLFRLKCQKKV